MPTDPEVRLHRSPVVRGVLIVMGTLALGVGILGIFLPLLPSAVFLLLAAACFARASDRFYRRLLANRLCGPVIREWREHRSVSRRAKRTALSMVLITFSVTITFFLSGPLVRVIVAGLGVGVFAIVWRLPVRERTSGPLRAQAAAVGSRER